jgi:hypothetical protein
MLQKTDLCDSRDVALGRKKIFMFAVSRGAAIYKVGIVLLHIAILILFATTMGDRILFLFPEVSGSNLGRENAYTESVRGLLQSFYAYVAIEPEIRPLLLPPTLFPIVKQTKNKYITIYIIYIVTC